MTIDYSSDEAVRDTERVYLTPEVAKQRAVTLEALRLRAGERVLDIGCGTGLLTRELARAVGPEGTVVALDASAGMLSATRERCASLAWVEPKAGGVERLPAADASFDAAACVQVLLYVEDVPAAMREMHRVLRPGARLAVVETDWRGVVLSGADATLTNRMFRAWDAAVPSPGLPARLGGLLRASGFDALRVEAIPLLATSRAPGTFAATLLDWTAAHARDTGAVTAGEAAAWTADLDALDREGAFFFCVNRFLFTGVRVSDRRVPTP